MKELNKEQRLLPELLAMTFSDSLNVGEPKGRSFAAFSVLEALNDTEQLFRPSHA